MIQKPKNLISDLWPLTSGRRLFAAALFAFSLIWLWSSGYKDAVTWGGFAFVLVRRFRSREKLNFGGLGRPLLAYLAVCAVSAWFSIDALFSWRAYWKLLELAAGFVALANLLRPGRRADLATTAVAVALLLAATEDCLRLAVDRHFGVRFETDGRLDGSRYGFPTIAAAVHAAGFVLCAALLLRARFFAPRLACAGGIALIGVLLLNFQTRSVFLGIGAGLLVLLASASRERHRALAAIGLSAAVLAAALLGSPAFRHKIFSGTFSDRIGIWHDAATVIRMQPQIGEYFGMGYGHGIFLKVHEAATRRHRAAHMAYNHVHNMVLETLVETGWPGLAAWLALLGTAARRFVRALRRAGDERRWTLAALAAALVTLIVYGQFSAFFALAPIFLFWNLLGILAAASAPQENFQPLEKPAA